MADSFDTVLVANRGEIAVRVIRTLRAMGIRSVAVFSDADAGARHVTEADVAVRIGPAPARQSYLSIDAVLSAVRRTGAQAVHPGYGFLSENAEFAAALEQAGIVFIGPPVAAIQTMGDKIAAKSAVSAFGVPVVPGISRPGLTDADLIGGAAEVGFPVLVKPSAGGGGKGMRVVHEASELPAALVSARREAAAAFGDDTLFLERFVLNPRHIEVQVVADGHGNVVHFGERECSLQRRHQKVIEEAPSPLLDAQTRARIGAAACDTARSVDYTGAGTVEFIVSADRPDEFFFMEMNTRLQVEHPVTELVTGVDLVELQVRIAAGEKLSLAQDDIAMTGHAIEARVYAEDPARDFLPTGGTVLDVIEPALGGQERSDRGIGSARIDSGIFQARSWAATTTRCSRRSSPTPPTGPPRSRHSTARSPRPPCWVSPPTSTSCASCSPIPTSWPVDSIRVCWTGARPTTSVAKRVTTSSSRPPPTGGCAVGPPSKPTHGTCHRVGGWGSARRTRSGCAQVSAPTTCTSRVPRPQPRPGSRTAKPVRSRRVSSVVSLPSRSTAFVPNTSSPPPTGRSGWLGTDARRWSRRCARHRFVPTTSTAATRNCDSPMPGTVVAIGIEDGETVTVGTVVVTVEAMKMEHALSSPVDGVVELFVAVGDQVKVGQPLARIIAATEEAQP